MGWTWRYESGDGTPVEPGTVPAAATPFPTQSDAETWIGEAWRDLVDDGVEQVWLEEDGRTVYGPMGLRPA